ncbi:MAG: HU family DNA-binding protein [Lachnospiraceae bacterium]|nr:HU family DNA-binding protein [Lachnospiraceae bacterium]
MNKKDLIDVVAKDAGMTKKDAEAALNSTLAAISGSLKKGEAVQLIGFGRFEVRSRKARTGTHPVTKKKVKIPASKAPVFKAGKTLKDTVNKK